MGIPNSLLGPILGGLLGFLGAIGAALLAFILSRRDRVRQTDEERVEHGRTHEQGHTPQLNNFPIKGPSTLWVICTLATIRGLKFKDISKSMLRGVARSSV